MDKKVLLMILDGWGISDNPDVSAIEKAKTPFIDSCYLKYPHNTLRTFGNEVGLPKGQMGNSEVGHINLGAGRVVYQNLTKIDKAIEEKTLQNEKELINAFEYAKMNSKKVHLIGLVSDGGVHAHISHLKALMDLVEENNVENVFIHAFTDGRDSNPLGGIDFIDEIEKYGNNKSIQIASVIGRYYAMDRDKRWERVKLCYDLLVHGKGKETHNFIDSIQDSYKKGVTDEFLKPLVKIKNGKPLATIEKNDVVIFFNFRTDRGRELTEVLTQDDYPEFNMKKLPLYFVTFTEYKETYKNIKVVFKEEELQNTLGKVLQDNHKTQLRIAETEKYPHVTFFFNGGNEIAFEGEDRTLCPSPKEVATYDLKPEMSAFHIRDKTVEALKDKDYDFICLNFANADMVGHTGVMDAAIKACETVDQCVESIVTKALDKEYTIIIIADHGNSDIMINPDGTPHTQHTTNPVPIIVCSKNVNIKVNHGKLSDIAPTILNLMKIPIPKEMNGNIIIT